MRAPQILERAGTIRVHLSGCPACGRQVQLDHVGTAGDRLQVDPAAVAAVKRLHLRSCAG